MKSEMKVPASQIMQALTLNITVTGMRGLAVRIWAGRWLIRLAARVMGCGIKIEDESP